MKTLRLVRLGVLCAALLTLAALTAGPALGAASDPLFVFAPEKPSDPKAAKIPPPTGYFEGICGLAVTPSGANAGFLAVSDYYHHAIDTVKPFGSSLQYVGQNANVDVLDGPCGLSFNSLGSLYVNNYHRNVTNLTAGALPLPSEDPAHHLPTGVAVDTSTDNVYVDNRTYISVFDSTGAPVMDGLNPLQIGASNLGDGNGLAVSEFPGTMGRVYVPDAAANTLKVFDPTLNKTTPIATIHGPGKGFTSLRDSAVAVDRVTGNVYVVDNLKPEYTEEPEAAIDVFNSTGTSLGVLKYKIYDALSPGLAVDNSVSATQGRVYVTSGNTDKAGIYAYPPGAQTNGFLPPTVGLVVHLRGSGGGTVSSPRSEIDCSAVCSTEVLSGASVALSATPDPGSGFTGWSGACSGIQGTCTVTAGEATSVSATFESEAGSEGEAAPALPASSNDLSAGPASVPHRPRQHHRHKHRHKVRHRHRAAHK